MLAVQQAQGPTSIFCIHSGIMGSHPKAPGSLQKMQELIMS